MLLIKWCFFALETKAVTSFSTVSLFFTSTRNWYCDLFLPQKCTGLSTSQRDDYYLSKSSCYRIFLLNFCSLTLFTITLISFILICFWCHKLLWYGRIKTVVKTCMFYDGLITLKSLLFLSHFDHSLCSWFNSKAFLCKANYCDVSLMQRYV